MTDDEGVNSDAVLAVAACQRLGVVTSDRWPMVAAHLVAAGFDGADLVALAALSANASSWEVDPLVPGALTEIDAPELTIDEAAETYARMLARPDAQDHLMVRTLAWLAPELNYPDGIINEAYYANEWLGCDCHVGSGERREADELEARLAALPPLDLPEGLVAALT